MGVISGYAVDFRLLSASKMCFRPETIPIQSNMSVFERSINKSLKLPVLTKKHFSMKMSNNRTRNLNSNTTPSHRIQSSVGVIKTGNLSSFAKNDSRKGNEFACPEASKPEIQAAYLNPEVLSRNKRIFGSLVGHLGLARKKLENDSELILKQTTMLNAVVQKYSETTKKINYSDQESKIKANTQQKIDRIEDSTARWKAYIEPLTSYLLTSIEPQLMWLPLHHNAATQDSLSNRKPQVSIG